jgi:hypothetical protein
MGRSGRSGAALPVSLLVLALAHLSAAALLSMRLRMPGDVYVIRNDTVQPSFRSDAVFASGAYHLVDSNSTQLSLLINLEANATQPDVQLHYDWYFSVQDPAIVSAVKSPSTIASLSPTAIVLPGTPTASGTFNSSEVSEANFTLSCIR